MPLNWTDLEQLSLSLSLSHLGSPCLLVDTTFRSHGDVGWGESSPQASTLHFDAQIYRDGHTGILQHGGKQTPVVFNVVGTNRSDFLLVQHRLAVPGLKCWAFPAQKNPELWLNPVVVFQFTVRTSLR